MTRGATPDVIVVGAGIVGAACADALTRRGLSVLVLDSRFAGAGVTAAGMGHIVVMDDSEAQFQLTAYSRRLWSDLAGELSRDCEDDPCGTVWIAETEEEWSAVRAKRAAYESHGVSVEVLDARALAEAEPNLRPGLAGGLRVPGDRVIYPPNAARWLLQRACARGARLREGCEVLAAKATEVELANERLAAAHVVNAARISPVPVAVVIPRPSWPAAIQGPGRCVSDEVHRPISGSLSGVAGRNPVQTRIAERPASAGMNSTPRRTIFSRMSGFGAAFQPTNSREEPSRNWPVARGWTLKATEGAPAARECALFRYPSSTS